MRTVVSQGLSQPLRVVALAPSHGLSLQLHIDFLSLQAPIDGAQSGPLVLNHVTTTRNVITVPSKNNKYTRSVNEVEGSLQQCPTGDVGVQQPTDSSQIIRDQQANKDP